MSQAHWNDVEVEEQKFTTWRNPTDKEQRVDLFAGPGKRRRIVFRPGEEVKVPSEYDRGIHDVRGGVTVGGYAVALERVSGATPLAPALEPPPPEGKAQAPAPKAEKKALPVAVEQDGAGDRAQRR